jgi:TonB family protein
MIRKIHLLWLVVMLLPAVAFIEAEHPFIEKLKRNLSIFNERLPDEKVYLVSDKPFYKPGETVWFSVFLVNGTDNKASSTSEMLYAELIDPKGNSVKKIHLLASDGVAKGDFEIAETMPGGIYKIRAYTKYMQLLDPNACFEKTIQVQAVVTPRILMKLEFERKAYSANDSVRAKLNVRSIDNKPLAGLDFQFTVSLAGEKFLNQTTQLSDSGTAVISFRLPATLETNDGLLNVILDYKGNKESISRAVPIVLNKIDLQFYPEGGYLVENVKSRLAFKALNEFGKPADVEGAVFDEAGQKVAEFRSFHDGMGAFDFQPQTGKTYKAMLTKPANITAEYAIKDILPEGFVLNVTKETDKLKVKIHSPRKETLHLVAQTKGVLQFTKTLPVKAGETLVDIPTSQFPCGVAQITLFDSKEQALCQRLMFVNPQKVMNISITADKAKYAPREKVNLKIRTTDENNNPVAAHLALSVVDDKLFTFADNKDDNILSYLLLSSDVAGKIEEPEFYFRPNEPKAPQALDYLLMTQGWKRFAWKRVVEYEDKELLNYSFEAEKGVVRGHIIDQKSRLPVANAKVWLFGLKDTVRTDKKGYFQLRNNLQRPSYSIFAKTDSSNLYTYYLNAVFSQPIFENNGIGGIITDVKTGYPLVNVKISLNSRAISFTNAEGIYQIKNGFTEGDTLSLFLDGYKQFKTIANSGIFNYALEKIEVTKKKRIFIEEINGEVKIKNNEIEENNESELSEENTVKFTAPCVVDSVDEGNSEISADDLILAPEEDQIEFEIVEANGDIIEKPNQVFEIVEEMPEFPGGEESLRKFLKENTVYPMIARENNIEGRVFVRFIVGANGEISDIRIARGVDPYLDSEAIRVISSLPRWKPGKQRGERVAVHYTVPITFRLAESGNYGTFNSNKYKHIIEILTKPANFLEVYAEKDYQGCSFNANDRIRDDFRTTIYWNPDVKTNEKGEAEVSFLNNEDETTFRAVAEGISLSGLIGRSEFTYAVQMPFAINAKVPAFLSFFDKVQIPVTLVNNTAKDLDGHFVVSPCEHLKMLKAVPESVKIAANSFKTIYLDYEVLRKEGKSKVQLFFNANGVSDFLEREITVVPNGFPQRFSYSGSKKEAAFVLSIPTYIDGSLKVKFKAYPNALADFTDALRGIIQKPYGCFEQVSSSTYPNILALKLMRQTGIDDYDISEKARKYIDMGYKKLTAYETSSKGYEWFGQLPPHEGLTAFGLMEFQDMKEVYASVDPKMVSRTTNWLLGRKDGKGGFLSEQSGYHGWGGHNAVQNAYIVYALSETGNLSAETELNTTVTEVRQSGDAYRLALVANSLFNYKKTKEANEVLGLLLAQVRAKGFAGLKAEHSVTYSLGESLKIETAALCLLAMLKSEKPNENLLNQGIQFILSKREQGMFGSTQSTILALKAMSIFFSNESKEQGDGEIEIVKNGKTIRNFRFDNQTYRVLTASKLEEEFKAGSFNVAVSQKASKAIPFSFEAEWFTLLPNSDKECMLGLKTSYAANQVKVAETLRLNVEITNRTAKGLPMSIAKIGIPAGLSVQPWQLKEMQEKKLFDFYEITDNYLIVYYRAFAPGEKKILHFDLKAEVPGNFNSPASCTYLYYTDEFKDWYGAGNVLVEK